MGLDVEDFHFHSLRDLEFAVGTIVPVFADETFTDGC